MHLDLRRAIGFRDIGYAAAITRPRSTLAGTGERPVMAAIGIDHPQCGCLAILHHIETHALIDDALAIRRDLRAVDPLQRENIHRFEDAALGVTD